VMHRRLQTSSAFHMLLLLQASAVLSWRALLTTSDATKCCRLDLGAYISVTYIGASAVMTLPVTLCRAGGTASMCTCTQWKVLAHLLVAAHCVGHIQPDIVALSLTCCYYEPGFCR
jgi:hypothetical protein